MKHSHPSHTHAPLKIIPLGGMGDVTKNCYVYEYLDDIIVVDCGIGFPEGDLLGVDIVIPDVTYLKEHAGKIRAILISHGHNDHYSALPYVLPQIPSHYPVYATKLVAGLIRNTLKEFDLNRTTNLTVINPDHDETIKLGNFSIKPFRVSHSVPDSVGFVIDTPAGKVVHVSDYKFDWTPVDGRIFDIRKLSKETEKGVDLLLSDCLGSHKTGFTRSERDIEKSFDVLMDDAKGQVFITTTSSNVSRIQQAINSSLKHGRKVILLGKSVRDNVTIAKELGYMNIPKGILLDPRAAEKYPPKELTLIVAGTYGQRGSALDRVAMGESKHATVSLGDMVIFSGDPSPSGVKDSVDRVVDKLTELGADVHYYEIQENLYVSGHGSQGDMLMLAALVSPKYFIPIGGSASMMRGYTKLLEHSGYNPKSVFELANGEVLELHNGTARVLGKVKVGDIFVDGLGIGDVGKKVIEERAILSESGVVFISGTVKGDHLRLTGDVHVTTKGFVFEKSSGELITRIREKTRDILKKELGNGALVDVKRSVENQIKNFLINETGREPIVLCIINEVA